MNFLEVLLNGTILSVVHATTTVFIILIFLRFFDKLVGYPFENALKEIRKDAKATAIYYSSRLLAVAIAIGLSF